MTDALCNISKFLLADFLEFIKDEMLNKSIKVKI